MYTIFCVATTMYIIGLTIYTIGLIMYIISLIMYIIRRTMYTIIRTIMCTYARQSDNMIYRDTMYTTSPVMHIGRLPMKGMKGIIDDEGSN